MHEEVRRAVGGPNESEAPLVVPRNEESVDACAGNAPMIAAAALPAPHHLNPAPRMPRLDHELVALHGRHHRFGDL